MTEYKPNSNKFKAEQKENQQREKIDKVINGQAKIRKNELRKLRDVFVAEDARNVKSYILMDVLVPAIKDAIEDIITNGIRMILRGDTAARKGSSNVSKVSYRNFYEDRHDSGRRYSQDAPRTVFSYDDIAIPSRGEAEAVLARMEEVIDRYQMVTVADLYDMLGVTGEYTANRYGWTNISSATVVRGRDGYYLKLPRALAMD